MFDDLGVLAIPCHGCDLARWKLEYLADRATALGCALSTREFENHSTDSFIREIREDIAVL
ncbi:hypothetical protein ACF1DY_35725 [Streptomyces albus]